ncbi:MAG: SGNH/GDSL hydrolase family protein [Pseudomonadota bacterium]
MGDFVTAAVRAAAWATGAVLSAALWGGAAAAQSAAPAPPPTPEIFVLGDSQITFGAGEPLLGLFENLPERCAAHWRKPDRLSARLSGLSVGVMGVRSTALESWTTTSGAPHEMVCEKDKKWGVNAGVYGASRTARMLVKGKLRKRRSHFEQVGEQPHNQFCTPGRTPFEAMFEPGYYAPKLFVMSFLGNGQARWRASPAAAAEDARRVAEQLPAGMPCVFMTTAPAYRAGTNRKRLAAQTAIVAAMRAQGRCGVVEGITQATRRGVEGQARFFYRKKSGAVRDPFHPNKAGQRFFVAQRTPAICAAVEEAHAGLSPVTEAAAR